jgi:hypothetical protein
MARPELSDRHVPHVAEFALEVAQPADDSGSTSIISVSASVAVSFLLVRLGIEAVLLCQLFGSSNKPP